MARIEILAPVGSEETVSYTHLRISVCFAKIIE